jgi:hypothetical protein
MFLAASFLQVKQPKKIMNITKTTKFGLGLATLSAVLFFGGVSESFAGHYSQHRHSYRHNHYRHHDHHYYAPGYYYPRSYVYYRGHRGYWRDRGGVRFFIRIP